MDGEPIQTPESPISVVPSVRLPAICGMRTFAIPGTQSPATSPALVVTWFRPVPSGLTVKSPAPVLNKSNDPSGDQTRRPSVGAGTLTSARLEPSGLETKILPLRLAANCDDVGDQVGETSGAAPVPDGEIFRGASQMPAADENVKKAPSGEKAGWMSFLIRAEMTVAFATGVREPEVEEHARVAAVLRIGDHVPVRRPGRVVLVLD
jgi:hypothetical protein